MVTRRILTKYITHGFYGFNYFPRSLYSRTFPFSNYHRSFTDFTMSEKINAFNKLGVSFNASEETVKKKYYALAKKLHPDTHPDNERASIQFGEISDAFKIAYIVAKMRSEYKKEDKKRRQVESWDPTSYEEKRRKSFEEEAAGIINFSRSKYEMKWNDQITGNSGVDWGGYFWAAESGLLDTNPDKKALPKNDPSPKKN